MQQQLTVTKRDGRRETIDLDRLHRVITWAAEELESTSAPHVDDIFFESVLASMPSLLRKKEKVALLWNVALSVNIASFKLEVLKIVIGVLHKWLYRRIAAGTGLDVIVVNLKLYFVRPNNRSPPAAWFHHN